MQQTEHVVSVLVCDLQVTDEVSDSLICEQVQTGISAGKASWQKD